MNHRTWEVKIEQWMLEEFSESNYCIVSREPTESAPSPVRTVTRKEIVPGVYGRVEVSEDDSYNGGTGIYINSMFSRADLLAAIATLQQIADALDA